MAAVHLTDQEYLVFDRFLDSVFARFQAGQISEGAAHAAINDVIAKIVEGHGKPVENMEFRELVRKSADA
jgi:hypothetical protein